MKNINQNLKKWPGMLVMVCALAVALSSCLKSHDNNPNPTQPIAALSVINASADAGVLDFYLNGSQVNASPITSGYYLYYFNAYAVSQVAAFYQTGTTAKVGQDTITLAANHYYSLFLAGLTSKPDFILTKDSVIAPPSGSVLVRFVNASPDAGAVDLVVKTSGTKLAQGEGYKGVSGFTSATLGVTDSLQIRQAGTANVMATVPGTRFASGSVYTVWLYGLANTAVATQTLKAAIMVNGLFN